MTILVQQRDWMMEVIDTLLTIGRDHDMIYDDEAMAEACKKAKTLKKRLEEAKAIGKHVFIPDFQCKDMIGTIQESILACWLYDFTDTSDVRRHAGKLLKILKKIQNDNIWA